MQSPPAWPSLCVPEYSQFPKHCNIWYQELDGAERNGLQWVTTARKPSISIWQQQKALLLQYWEQKNSRFSFYSPYLDLATENFVGRLEDLKQIPLFCCQRIQGSRKPGFQASTPPLYRDASLNVLTTESRSPLRAKCLLHSLKRCVRVGGGTSPSLFISSR